MRALEFKSKIKDNRILIPAGIQSELKTDQDKEVRVIVLIDDSELYDNLIFQQSTQSQFLKGYADSDSIYDSYWLWINWILEISFYWKFPFTDGKTFKKRPALIINDYDDGDIIVCRITSQIYNTQYDISVDNWGKYGLKLPSVIRVHKLATLKKDMVEIIMGQIDHPLKEKVRTIIKQLKIEKFTSYQQLS